MKPNYLVHENVYVEIKQAGWQVWGGDNRLAKAELASCFLDVGCLKPRDKIPEVGCGGGHHCQAFEKPGYEVPGVDVSLTAIEWAQEKTLSLGSKGNL
jgi:2-polyprenyl-3-methyl-5-hydroxy-6-metoxy-1,4-benzoquinol methylase